MKQRRQRLADFEARSVQLIAACTLGLAGLASVPPAQAARGTGQATSLMNEKVHPAPISNTGAKRPTAVLLQGGKARN